MTGQEDRPCVGCDFDGDGTEGHCNLCHDHVPDVDILEHLRIMHPDAYEPTALWPDGRPVIVDTALEPGDFSGT